MNDHKLQLLEHLEFIYGETSANDLYERISNRLTAYRQDHPEIANASPEDRFNENDCILITYGDMVQEEGRNPLLTLTDFLTKHLASTISTVHILPFYPYSSDDGFSVIDYRRVNPDLGRWEDIDKLGKHFRLMFDAVINHISSQSEWFRGFLEDDPKYRDYFTVVDEDADLSQVFRPRATPILTPFQTPSGEKLVWTTFSSDQIDLNFRNPEALIEVIDILLFYVTHGAEFIRLDAVTFIWKEIGTTCINMPRTHRVVQLLRTILNLAAPRVAVITETNVPHIDNIAYFGDGTNEAQMVYNFALPLLTLHAFHTREVKIITEWTMTLDLPSDQVSFFNFLAGHDGIGMLPVKDILSTEDLDAIAKHTIELGGNVSYKSNEDGSKSPYELNINYLDALSPSRDSVKDNAFIAQRFLASQAIMLALRGVPGIYFHSLFGSRNWSEGVDITGRYRTINREKLDVDQLEEELADSNSLRHHIFSGFCELLEARISNPAFHPNGGQEVLSLHGAVFSVLRTSRDRSDQVLCLHNVTDERQRMRLPVDTPPLSEVRSVEDIFTNREFKATGSGISIELSPYQILWLRL